MKLRTFCLRLHSLQVLVLTLGLGQLSLPPAQAVPVDTPASNQGFAAQPLTGAAIEFVFTEAGRLPQLPGPVRGILFTANQGAILDAQGSQNPAAAFGYAYQVVSPTTAHFFSRMAGAPRPDMDVLTFTAPNQGTFVNQLTQAKGTFSILRNAMNDPRALLTWVASSAANAGANATGAVIQTTAPKRPRAPAGTRDNFPLAGEQVFDRLFDSVDEPVAAPALAFLYEARVENPDYFTLCELTLKEFKLAGNDEFRKRRFIKENQNVLEAKLDRAAAHKIITFGRSYRKVDYDFSVGGYPWAEPYHQASGFECGYGYVINNLSEARYFKIAEEKAQSGRVAAGSNPTYDFQIFAVVEGIAAPHGQYNKVLSVRVIAVSMFIGRDFKGLYRVDKKTWQSDQNPKKDFADIK